MARKSRAKSAPESTPEGPAPSGAPAVPGTPLPPPPLRADGPPAGMLFGVEADPAAVTIALDRIVPDPDQPRKDFDPEELMRLSRSLAERGQLQPIRVRWSGDLDRYVVVAGERRHRAAALAGMPALACVVAPPDDGPARVLEDQVVENTLRSDLSPIETANALARLMGLHGWNRSTLAAKLSMDKARVSRTLALLDLPEEVQGMVESGELSATSAYEASRLPKAEDQVEVSRRAVAEKMTSEDVADAVREIAPEVSRKRKAPAAPALLDGNAVAPVSTPPKKFDVAPNCVVSVSWKGEATLSVQEALKLAAKQARKL